MIMRLNFYRYMHKSFFNIKSVILIFILPCLQRQEIKAKNI